MENATTVNVLLLEDSKSDALLLSRSLEQSALAKFKIHHEERLEDGLSASRSQNFDAVILDLCLPDSDGLLTLETFRKFSSAEPILVLTGMSDELLGLEAIRKGADEYFIKGELSGEQLARFVTQAIERKRGRVNFLEGLSIPPATTMKIKGIDIDFLKQTVFLNHDDRTVMLDLTPTEFKILAFFANHMGKVFSRAQIVAEIWKSETENISLRTVDKHISSLKKKCSPALDQLLGVYGVGYCLAKPS